MANNLSKPRKKRKKKGSNNYFNKDTEAAIIRFQEESDLAKRKKIFVEEVRPAFAKLIENLLFVYKFHAIGNIEILKNDCLSFLYESIHKFDGTRGHKAFSYFNVIAKNWLSQKRKNYKKNAKSDIHFDNTVLANLEKDNHLAVVVSYEDEIFKREFLEHLKAELKAWRNKFEKPQEKIVLEAIIILFENPDMLPLYNKKGIYMYLREITGMNTKQIVTNLVKFRKKYEYFKTRYLSGEM